jgi:D-alanyl-D-alanine dipeptidase
MMRRSPSRQLLPFRKKTDKAWGAPRRQIFAIEMPRSAEMRMRRTTRANWSFILSCTILVFFYGFLGSARASGKLPGNYVYLREVDPTIVQDIRYATPANFTQAVVPGYQACECIVLREAAEGLKQVQADLRVQGLALKVYDCYRPVHAVKAFMQWVDKPEAAGGERYRPRTERGDLVKLGYIAAHSIHSKGAAIDLTLVALPLTSTPAFNPKEAFGPCNGAQAKREPDNSLDMGTSFDCFDPMSTTMSAEITREQAANRKILVDAMAARGFKNYASEWWHFTYVRLPSIPNAEDFVITSRTRVTAQPLDKPNPLRSPRDAGRIR